MSAVREPRRAGAAANGGRAVASGAGPAPRQTVRQPQRLMRSVLGPVDIAASTMANIAPAMSFYFGFGFLALTAGIASPLTIIAAGVAIAFLGNTLAQFSRAHPSTGSFITFIGKAFGPTSAIATAVILITGYVVAIISVLVMSGGFTAIFLNHYVAAIPTSTWPWFMIVFVSLAAFLMVRGIHISTRWAGIFFAFEMVVLVVVTISTLVHHADHLTLHPFDPHYLSNGFKGLGLGFPLAVYLFIGWENSAALAEETENPRRNVPRALFASVALMMVSYVLFAYATVEGFGENVAALSASPIPFITVADSVLGVLAFFAYLAGVTSTLACLIAAVNSQSRLLFNAGREGLLPAWVGRVYARRQTPVNALLTFTGIGFVLVFAWSFGQHIDPVTLFAEASTLGTILVVVVYFVANLALPVFYRKHHPEQLSLVRHLIVPLVGAALIALPIYELVKPGQASPYDWFPYIALAVIVVAVVYAVILNARDATLADRVGSLVADDATDGKFAGFLDDEEEEELHRLHRVVSCLNQDRDTKPAVQEALQIVAEALHMASAAVFVVKPNDTAEVLAACGDTRRGFPYPPLDLADKLVAGLIKRPRVVEIEDPARLDASLLAVTGREVGRVVIAPQSAGPDVAAILVLGRDSRVPLSKREAEFVAVVSEAMGLAIRSRSLAAESQHTAAVLQTAYAVSRAITQSLDLELTYREIAANAARVARGSHCLLFELERGSGDCLAVACSDPESEELLGTRVRLEDDSGGPAHDRGPAAFVVGKVIPGDRTDARSASKFSLGGHLDARLAGMFNAESSVFVPLFAQQELVGALLVYASGRRRRYSALEIAELRSVGEQAAIAIHNALLYRNLAESQASIEALLTRLTRIREQERQALARVVHDDIVQSIVGAIYRLDDVRDTLAEGQTGEFDQAVAVLRQSVDDARRVIWELRPPAIDGLGLPAALRSLADRAGQGQASVKVSIEEIAGLSDTVTTGLYKIAREALLNALHHASARQIDITLVDATSSGRTTARLLVEDDGVGFVAAEHPDGGHYGTVMMEEQATLIGATMSIDTEPGCGTRVEVVVPLPGVG